jgi:hypothetical protein
VDSTFEFLSSTNLQLLNEILNRRNPRLIGRIRDSHFVSRTDAEELLATLSEEFTDHLDKDWEPTEYARKVDSLLDAVNAARIQAWPD